MDSKWIKNLNLRLANINLLEENIGKAHKTVCFEKTPEAKAIQAKTDKWDYSKLSSFCPANETFFKMKKQLTTGIIMQI